MTSFAVGVFATCVQYKSERALLVRKRRQYEEHARKDVPVFAVWYLFVSVINKTKLPLFSYFCFVERSLRTKIL